jgi:hypothetical protein
LLVFVLGCMGCCCGGLPLFGLWPSLDPAPVEAALRRQPLVVDHTCAPDVVCTRVESIEVTLLPMSYSLTSGQITALVDVQATCSQAERRNAARNAARCAGVVAAVYESAGEGWELAFVTESTAGSPPSGQPYEGGGGGDGWD